MTLVVTEKTRVMATAQPSAARPDVKTNAVEILRRYPKTMARLAE